MKILIFNWRDGLHPQAGGAEAYLHETAARWAAHGHHVALVSAHPMYAPRSETTYRGITVVRVGSRYRIYAEALLEYKRRWRGWADVVLEHINGIPFLTPLYVEEPVVAVIYHIVGRIFFEELPAPLALAGFTLERALPAFYRKVPVVTISQSSRIELAHLGFSPSQISVIPIGLSERVPAVGLDRPEPVVLSVGRLKAYKRLELLVEAADLVIHQFPHALFVVAGRGDYETRLRHLIHDRGLDNWFNLLGYVSEEEKNRLYRRGRVLVVTSEKEGWGITVMEAARSGTPAVGFDTPGVRDAIIHGKTGVLVPDRDVERLAETIVELLREEGRRRTLGENAFRHSQGFRWDETALEIMKVMERAAASRSLRATS